MQAEGLYGLNDQNAAAAAAATSGGELRTNLYIYCLTNSFISKVQK
jgi:hypothetical protein